MLQCNVSHWWNPCPEWSLLNNINVRSRTNYKAILRHGNWNSWGILQLLPSKSLVVIHWYSWKFWVVIGRVGMYWSKVAEGFSAFNAALVFVNKRMIYYCTFKMSTKSSTIYIYIYINVVSRSLSQNIFSYHGWPQTIATVCKNLVIFVGFEAVNAR